jgi:HNH endonuclease
VIKCTRFKLWPLGFAGLNPACCFLYNLFIKRLDLLAQSVEHSANTPLLRNSNAVVTGSIPVEILNENNLNKIFVYNQMKKCINENNYILYSPEDHNLISNLNISMKKDGYLKTTIEGKCYRIHRLIMNPEKGEIVDHINGNRLDNTRKNLRITNSQENSENTKKRVGTTSLYKGVSFIKKEGIYSSKITFKKRNIYIGRYLTDIEAAEAYDLYIIHHSPSLFKLNFPEKMDKYILMKEEGTILTEYTGIKRIGTKYISNLGDKELYFNSPYKAAIYRDNFIVKHNKKARLNFPENHLNYLKNSKVKTLYKNVNDSIDIVQLIINSSPDSYVTIDRSDYDSIKQYTFNIDKKGRVNSSNQYNTISLNRLIMNENNPHIYIDHIDRNPSNNTRSNLRRSDALKNSQNKSKSKNKSSKYVGVSYEQSKQKWRASLHVDGKTTLIGRFDSEEESAIERDKYILKFLPDSHFPLSGLDLSKNFKQNDEKKKTSKYIGVCFDKSRDKWSAYFQNEGKRKKIGRFKSEEEAAIARDSYILKNHPNSNFSLSGINLS